MSGNESVKNNDDKEVEKGRRWRCCEVEMEVAHRRRG